MRCSMAEGGGWRAEDGQARADADGRREGAVRARAKSSDSRVSQFIGRSLSYGHGVSVRSVQCRRIAANEWLTVWPPRKTNKKTRKNAQQPASRHPAAVRPSDADLDGEEGTGAERELAVMRAGTMTDSALLPLMPPLTDSQPAARPSVPPSFRFASAAAACSPRFSSIAHLTRQHSPLQPVHLTAVMAAPIYGLGSPATQLPHVRHSRSHCCSRHALCRGQATAIPGD